MSFYVQLRREDESIAERSDIISLYLCRKPENGTEDERVTVEAAISVIGDLGRALHRVFVEPHQMAPFKLRQFISVSEAKSKFLRRDGSVKISCDVVVCSSPIRSEPLRVTDCYLSS